jgi:hypothetical protein
VVQGNFYIICGVTCSSLSLYHPLAYFVMFVSGEFIMYGMEWLHYTEEVTDFLHRKGIVIGLWKLS